MLVYLIYPQLTLNSPKIVKVGQKGKNLFKLLKKSHKFLKIPSG